MGQFEWTSMIILGLNYEIQNGDNDLTLWIMWKLILEKYGDNGNYAKSILKWYEVNGHGPKTYAIFISKMVCDSMTMTL